MYFIFMHIALLKPRDIPLKLCPYQETTSRTVLGLPKPNIYRIAFSLTMEEVFIYY